MKALLTYDEEFVLSQKEESFCSQYLQVPQAIWNEQTTRCPTLTFVTLGPTRSTFPMNYKVVVRE